MPHAVPVGIESGDDGMLKKYSKMITTEEIRDKTALINRLKSKSWAISSSAFPGKRAHPRKRTIGLAKTLKLDIASFAVATPDLGTRLRAEAIERGWISSDLLTLGQYRLRDFRNRRPFAGRNLGLADAGRARVLSPAVLCPGNCLGVRSLRDFRGLVSQRLLASPQVVGPVRRTLFLSRWKSRKARPYPPRSAP